jgi:ABC-2 type transport system permease protein
MTTAVRPLPGNGLRAEELRAEATRAPLGRALRSELRWILLRRRSLFALLALAIVPILIGVGIAVAGGSGGAGMFALLKGNGMALPVITLVLLAAMLLPLVASMFAADALAGESASGTMRGLLVAPVNRMRLLGMKAFGVGVASALAVVITTLVAIVSGIVFLGGTGMLTLSGNTVGFVDALGRLGIAVAWTVLQVWAIAAVALAISAFTEHPLVVLAYTLAGIVLFTVMGQISTLSAIHPFLITNGLGSAVGVLADPIDTSGLGQSSLVALCYLVIGLGVAAMRLAKPR